MRVYQVFSYIHSYKFSVHSAVHFFTVGPCISLCIEFVCLFVHFSLLGRASMYVLLLVHFHVLGRASSLLCILSRVRPRTATAL